MKYKAVVFDFYGVIGLNGWQDFKLLHFDGRWDDWEPLRQLGQLVDSGLASEDEFVEAIADATTESTEVVRRQFAQTDINLELLDFIEQKIKPHYKVGLLSNASFDVVSALLSPEQTVLFNVVLMSASLGLTKPDPQMFARIVADLGVHNDEIVFVDDQDRHLEAAERIGMKTVQFTSTDQAIKELNEVLSG